MLGDVRDKLTKLVSSQTCTPLLSKGNTEVARPSPRSSVDHRTYIYQGNKDQSKNVGPRSFRCHSQVPMNQPTSETVAVQAINFGPRWNLRDDCDNSTDKYNHMTDVEMYEHALPRENRARTIEMTSETVSHFNEILSLISSGRSSSS